MVKSGAIEKISKSHEPFQSYLLTGLANSAKKAHLFKTKNRVQIKGANQFLKKFSISLPVAFFDANLS